jgi:cytochrome c
MPPKIAEKKEPNVTVPDGDAAAGRGIFDFACADCHALQGDNKTAYAPTLGNIIGRTAGATTFPYSKVMKGAGFNWTKKHLFAFVENPGKYVPGNKMAFPGIKGEQERADLVAYFESL